MKTKEQIIKDVNGSTDIFYVEIRKLEMMIDIRDTLVELLAHLRLQR